MKRLYFLLILLCWCGSAKATTFTEWYCNTNGNNLNSGSTTNYAALTTHTGTWYPATNSFVLTDAGNLTTDGLTNGAYVSIYTTSGATNANAIFMVTNIVGTTILTVNTNTGAGTIGVISSTADAVTCKWGGAWAGPNTFLAGNVTAGFPFYFVKSTMTNTAGNMPCFNFQANGIYNTSNAITCGNSGPMLFQGYTTTPHDGGRARVDGGTTYPSYTLLTISGSNLGIEDFELSNNGANGAGVGLTISGSEDTIRRCVFHDFGGNGLASGESTLAECEFYSCNKNNNANGTGCSLGSDGAVAYRCISHDNTGSSASGFRAVGRVSLINCVADSNGQYGVAISSTAKVFIKGLSAYNNTAAGIAMTGTSQAELTVENSIFALNGSAITNTGSAGAKNGYVIRPAYGSGTKANTAGTIVGANMYLIEVNPLTLAADTLPWTDAPNGNFSVNLASVEAAGVGNFLTTSASYGPTVGYPDIGAVQNASTNTVTVTNTITVGGTSGHSHSFIQ